LPATPLGQTQLRIEEKNKDGLRTMQQLDNFYGYFNLVLGTIFLLTSVRILKPFKGEEGEKRFKKWQTFYIIGGAGLIIWGLVKIF
jgi:hypothetical protein